MEQTAIWLWSGFGILIVSMLTLDLGIFNRRAHEPTFKEAAIWSAVWVSLALGFNAVIYYFMGAQPAVEFLTGYLIEKALSVDNIFVFVMLFSVFAVPIKFQHRVLFWGIIGAFLMRGIMIALGAYLIEQFHWVIYLFGAILVFTGAKMALQNHNSTIDTKNNLIVRWFRKFMPVTDTYREDKFFVKEKSLRAEDAGQAVWFATPLFLVLLLVEATDLIFAVDSIPAIFAVTRDPFLVFSSNVFAILGLRSMYFMLAGIVHRFHLLKFGLAFILVFVGAKMLFIDIYKIPVLLSLAVIAVTVAASVVLSLAFPKQRDGSH
ncbi:MAG: TerC family protein [Candidatus Obscuribacter sp.]|nr:TerC family protein [Candidatus Obscuribacter sp.]MBK9282483.1 TerC family protein [Candidatus Obscuribacter sp.]